MGVCYNKCDYELSGNNGVRMAGLGNLWAVVYLEGSVPVGRYCHVLTLSAYIAPATDTKRPWYSGLLAQLTKRIAGRGVTYVECREDGGETS